MEKFEGLWKNISSVARRRAKKMYKKTVGMELLKNDYKFPRVFLPEILKHIDKNYSWKSGQVIKKCGKEV